MASPARLPAVPGGTGESPEKSPVAIMRTGREAGALLRTCGTKISGIEFAEEFSVVEQVDDSGSDSGERYDKHHAEEHLPVHQCFDEPAEVLPDEFDLARDIDDEDVVNDGKFPECLRLCSFGGDDRLIPPFGVAPQRGDDEVPGNDDPHHPCVHELETDEGEQGGRSENLVGKRVEEFSPPGDVAIPSCDPPVIPISERGDDIGSESEFFEKRRVGKEEENEERGEYDPKNRERIRD